MSAQHCKTHQGFLMGKILAGAKTLIYNLHKDADGQCYTRITEMARYTETYNSMRIIAISLGNRVYGIWKNTSEPAWYYIQLQEHCYPTMLHSFNIPITARLGAWTLVMPE